MNDYIAYWDKTVREWAEKGEVPVPESFWFSEQRHLRLHPLLMPEPYWGDIDRSSVVFVNMNPAGAAEQNPADTCHHHNRHDSSTVCGLMSQSYSSVARTFPLLGEFPFGYGGSDWWHRRVKWASHFGIGSDIRPFAMELCAWHSKSWGGARYNPRKAPGLHRYIQDVFAPALRRALRGSEFRLALCVGSEFAHTLFPLVWPGIEDITSRIIGNPCPVPGNARRFWVFRIPQEGHVVCTSARGSNVLPSEHAFGEIERKILRNIKIYKT